MGLADIASLQNVRKALKVTARCVRRCVAFFATGSPPEPCREVQELLRLLKLQPKHLLMMYDVFHSLGQEEDKVVTRTVHIDADCVSDLVVERRQWVQHLLNRLLLLGDCQDLVPWDKFLWIFLRFCSLNKVELGQTLFVMIAKEVESPTLHYLTSEALSTYFGKFKNCPVKSFNTESMDFDKLPLTRYYPSDFCEVVMRFPRLLNPLIHLQLSLQKYLPSSAFWDNFDQSSFCRKVTFEFFTINHHRVYIRGEPPFRETCDMLGPDALGPEPVNKDQWILRTSDKLKGNGLRHISVWGEQMPPEILDLLPHSSQGEDAMQAAVDLINAKVYNWRPAHAVRQPASQQQVLPTTLGNAAISTGPSKQALPSPPVPANPVVAWGSRPDQPPQIADMSKLRAQAELEPRALAVSAAILDEDEAGPATDPPPGWMSNCTVAPAPVLRGSDPPLPMTRAPKPPSRQSMASRPSNSRRSARNTLV